MIRPPPRPTLFPYTPLSRSRRAGVHRMTAGRVAVIGAGTMGHGIAYAAALAGFDVRLTDSKPDALRFAMGRLNDLLARSEEHTSELQSRSDLVCRLLLEKKN